LASWGCMGTTNEGNAVLRDTEGQYRARVNLVAAAAWPVFAIKHSTHRRGEKDARHLLW
jgi:hypothetical protein